MIKDIIVNLGQVDRDPAGDYAISVADAFERASARRRLPL